MKNNVNKSVIQELKEELQLVGDYEDDELLRQLRLAIKQSHPDNFKDETVKEESSERFKKLIDLRQRFTSYLEQKTLNLPSTELANPKFEIIKTENEIISIQLELYKEREKRSSLESDNKNKEAIIKEKEEELGEFREKRSSNTYSELLNIYSIKRRDVYMGISSVVLIIVSQIKAIETLLNMIFIDSQVYIIIVRFITICLVIWCVIKYISSLMVKHIVSTLINAAVFHEFYIRSRNASRYTSNKEYYILESDVLRKITEKISKFPYSIFFMPQKEYVKTLIGKYIIDEFLRRKLFTEAYSTGLDRAFIVSPPIDSNVGSADFLY